MEHRWNDTDRGKEMHSEKNLSEWHFFHHKFHMNWPGFKPRPAQWVETRHSPSSSIMHPFEWFCEQNYTKQDKQYLIVPFSDFCSVYSHLFIICMLILLLASQLYTNTGFHFVCNFLEGRVKAKSENVVTYCLCYLCHIEIFKNQCGQ